MAEPWYCVREDVKQALDVLETARANGDIDRQIGAGARAIDGRLHRVFYPTVATRSFDWPDLQVARPWRQWLDSNELISITSVSSGGVAIPLNTVIPYPNTGPPYNRVELNVSTTSAWSATATWQNSITIAGLYGFRADEIPAGTLAGNLNATDTAVNLGVPGYRGVGSILRIDTERLIVTGRASTTTGQTLGVGGLTASNAATLVPVADITQFALGETILIDAERMLVQDAAGTNLIVKRAYDGSVLAAHTAGATIYANRLLTVVRGALGTTAASHTGGAAIAEHDPPSLIRQLNVAQAVVNLVQTRAGYPQPISNRAMAQQGTSGNRPITRPSDMTELWDQAYTLYGRKTRVRTV